MRIRKMHHIGLHIDDVAASTEFYVGVLGLSPASMPAATDAERARFKDLITAAKTPPPSGVMWIEAPGGMQIHMLKADSAEGLPNPFGPHVAFEVEDLEESKRELDARGIPYVVGPSYDAFRQLWLLDPSGNTVELWIKA